MRLVLCLLAVLAAAAPTTTFETGMKAIGDSFDALGKMEVPTGPAAIKAAERMESAFRDMSGYWKRRGAADAVKLSETGMANSVGLIFAANPFPAADPEEAKARLKIIGGTCRPCHDQYREKLPDGRYRLK